MRRRNSTASVESKVHHKKKRGRSVGHGLGRTWSKGASGGPPDSALCARRPSMSYREGGQGQGSTRLAASFAAGPTAAPGPRSQSTPTLLTAIHWVEGDYALCRMLLRLDTLMSRRRLHERALCLCVCVPMCPHVSPGARPRPTRASTNTSQANIHPCAPTRNHPITVV